jgi:hypothetical protein
VLAKRPDERYGSCREFVEAARMALGIFGPGTESSLAFGTMLAGPPIGAPSGSQAGAPPDRFSWSNMASQAPAADPVAPGAGQDAYSQPGYGQPGYDQPGSGQGGSHQPGGTRTSHRREYGISGPGEPGQPAGAQPPPGRPRGPRWYRQPRWLALLAVLILVVAGLGTWAGLSGSSSHKGNAAMPSMSAKPKPKSATPSALMAALRLTNRNSDAKGLLPPSTCKQQGSNMVTCVAPTAGISEVEFHTYPNLTALYNAYMAEVMSHSSSGQFKQNYNDCGLEQTVGEVGWNHQFQHPKTYTVAEMSAGTVTDDQAAGRVFCNFTQGLEYMVWTQDDGHVLGVVAGTPHENVWNWWLAIHHNIGLGGSPINMNMPLPSSSPSMKTTPSSTSSMSPSMSPSASMSSTGG